MSTSLDDAPLAQPGAASALAALDRKSPLRVLVASLPSCARCARVRSRFARSFGARCARARRFTPTLLLAALALTLAPLDSERTLRVRVASLQSTPIARSAR